MITGFNTEIKVGKKVYHIQTEDKGEKNPIIETLIYVGGEIIDAYRTSYGDLLNRGLDKEKLRIMMQQQHNNIISLIRQGKYTKQAAEKLKDIISPKIELEAAKNELQNDVESLEDLDRHISNKTLDQVILEHLEKHSAEEKLILEIVGDDRLMEGKPASLLIKSINEANHQPVPKIKIVIKVISTVKKPILIYDGFTNELGELVPEFPGGNAAIIIQAFSNIGNYEIKRLIVKSNLK